MPNKHDSFSEFAGALRGVIGLTRPNRLREHIQNSLALYELANKYPELDEAKENLGNIITMETRYLQATVDPKPGRKWDWGEFFVGIIFTALIVWGIWPWHSYWNYWWGKMLLIVLGLLSLVCLIVSLQALFEKPTSTKETVSN